MSIDKKVRKIGFGFSFDTSKCQECGGKCCVGKEGYIFVNIEEMLDIAQMLGMDFQDFTQKFVRKVGYKFSLIEKPYNNELACVFYHDTKCKIYQKRPRQCRDFPFWGGYKEECITQEDKEFLQQECIGVQFEI